MLVTLRDTPADAVIPSHQLLIRGGYIRRVTNGIYAYMPLMWRVLRKIIAIVQEEMDNAGSLQTLLPQLHPAELWEKSGRWQSYTEGEGIMFHLKDRQGKALGLGPTHEEVVTTLAGELLNSYRQLPINIYQIQTKFRDEIRPRFGLMRSREFIMKDAYSFHANEEDLQSTYKRMEAAYKTIFDRCGLITVGVDADSGAIGGAASQEFMVTAEAGEDLILIANDGKYSANQEKAISIAPNKKVLNKENPSILETSNQNSIEDLCTSNNLDPTQIVKVLALIATIENNETQPLLLSLRADQDLNDIKLSNEISKILNAQVFEIKPITVEQLKIQGLSDWPFGSLGPDLDNEVLNGAKSWKKTFLRCVDHTAADLESFVCGANEIGYHRSHATWETVGGIQNRVDIRTAKHGDKCIHDPTQALEECRGIEVGHIFQLGRKYSKALEVGFTNEAGHQEPFWMGCYGIGVSRLAQAAVEQNHDELGICWPLTIAPFEAIVVIANQKDEIQRELGEKVYKNLLEAGIDALLDDRNERAGVKFKDADLIGIPFRIVVGREASLGKVELFKRQTRQLKLLSVEEAQKQLLSEIFANKG